MANGFLEGLIKPEINVETDMSEKTNNTYKIGTYIDRPVINIDKLIICDKEMMAHVINVLQHQVSENKDTDSDSKPQ